jgi:predicted transcriptional regulator
MVGNISNYTSFDILRTFLAIEENISRTSLVKKLGLGEGTVRTVLDILKKKELIKSTQLGHSYSGKGKFIIDKINKIIQSKKLESKTIYKDYKKVALLLKNKKDVDVDYKLRDVAVKNGAEGALIFIYKDKLILPGVEHTKFKELDDIFKYNKNDLLIIAFSPSYRWSENAALAVAIEVDKELGKLVSL